MGSSAADVMYACSDEKFLPGKHLSLGLTVKSITGSKNAVTLLNKFGHCASNEKIRRIDIGIESTISQQDTLLPDQFLRDPNLNPDEEIINALEEWNNQKKLEINNPILVKIVD